MRIRHSTVIKHMILGLLMFFVLLTGCKSNENQSTSEAEKNVHTESEAIAIIETEPEEESVELDNTIQIITKYVSFFYPDKYSEVLQHREVVSEEIVMEIFSMVVNESPVELFRIYFGDEAMGITCGYLTVDGVEIPVTYTICQYDDNFFDEETKNIYFETMNCFNDIMDSIQSDRRFSIEKAVTPVINTDAVCTYWSFSLPETMEYEERNSSDKYELRFYGNVAGEKIALYTIVLGDTEDNTVLGTYALNGSKKYLKVESYPIEPLESWTDEETELAYTMMGTVNTVLQTIMSNENYEEYFSE